MASQSVAQIASRVRSIKRYVPPTYYSDWRMLDTAADLLIEQAALLDRLGEYYQAWSGSRNMRVERHDLAPDLGSRVVSVGPVNIACMAKDSREALNLAMERWDAQRARIPVPDDPVYQFAYWLFRWSGIVTGVNLDAPENPWATDGNQAATESSDNNRGSAAP